VCYGAYADAQCNQRWHCGVPCFSHPQNLRPDPPIPTSRPVVPSGIGYYLNVDTLTIKVPPQLAAALAEASAQEHSSKSELVRRALEAYLQQRRSRSSFVSALDRAGDLVGCFEGGPDDLASNPEHLRSFGRD